MSAIVMNKTMLIEGQYFLFNHQYDYCGTENRIDNGQSRIHYIVTLNSKTYYIPDYACIEYDDPKHKQNQDVYAAIERDFEDHTPDWMEQWEKISGIKINNGAGADIDLREYKSLVNEKHIPQRKE